MFLQDPAPAASMPSRTAAEALGPGGNRSSPASSTRSLDLQRLPSRADSAYSSFSAASGGPEPRTPSPRTDLFPYLDWDYVRAVRGGPAPASAAAPHTPARRAPVPAASSGPRSAEVRGAAEPLSRQATPLLCALAAEAEAAARAAEPLSPPASRAAYRQRLRSAQRRVLRETSFQRKELRVSLPARLRPAPPARPAAEHARSASLSHPDAAAGRARSRPPAPGTASPGRLANQQGKWCFSEPAKLACGDPGHGPAGECPGEACFSSGLTRWEPQELQHRALAEFEGHQIGWLPSVQPPGTADPDPGSLKLGEAYRPASQSWSASGDVLGPWRGSERVMAVVKTDPQVAEPPRPFCQTKLSSSYASDQQHGANLGQRAGPATVPLEHPLRECPETAEAGDCWQGVNSSVGVSRTTCCSPAGTANGDIPSMDDSTGLLTTDPPAAAESDPLKLLPTDALGPPGRDTPGPLDHTALAWGTGQPGSRPSWPSQRLEELVQELARLDSSLGDALVPHPSPEPPLGLLDGLIPLAEVWATMGPACGGAGKEDAVISEPGFCLLNSAQLLLTSQEESSSENPTTHPLPDQPVGQGCPELTSSIHAKKVELADLLQKMLQDLHAEQERLRGVAQVWVKRRAALETAVSQACAPRELERFIRFMADLERVLGLLLLLGSRLGRVHRALARAGEDSDPEERASLLQRLRLLQRQQEDAKELKEHVARRERALREVLVRALPEEGLRAYCSLLAGKAAVLAQQRSLDERARLLQEQLDAIRSDLGHHTLCPRPAWPPETCS
ncbi:protein Shroom1 isoform X5 [Dasypus novemcinctus]|uniref:protein Shroom1 isoform X5 n=1 Tax=Dasypus novemcinctus TaxID=9361 RepID=UPI00265E4E58|nr:protein Shroom1 isoform X3 [Dasypus novemcinctus]